MGVVVNPAAIVRFTIATVPLAITPVFKPVSRHEYTPTPGRHRTFFPALVADGPGVTEMPTMLPTGYLITHWRADGCVAVPANKVRPSETVPFAAAVPEDKASESVWAQEQCAVRKTAAIRIDFKVVALPQFFRQDAVIANGTTQVEIPGRRPTG